MALKRTSYGWKDAAMAFLLGQMFSLFLIALCLGLLIASLVPHGYVIFGVLAAAYVARVLTSNLHITGAGRSKAFTEGPYNRHIAAYFETSLVTDAGDALKPGQPYIFGVGPHGIHGFGLSMLADESAGSPFYKTFPFLRGKLVGLVATVLFRVPIVRELFLLSGYRDASRSTCKRALKEGNSLYLIVGGEAESLLSRPGRDDVVLAGKGRKGLIRLALETGAPLVPVHTFGNSDTYNTSFFLYGLRKWLSKKYRVCLPLFTGRWWSPMPFNVKLTVAVGAPVPLPERIPVDAHGHIDAAVVDAYHQAFLDAYRALFERWKGEAGYPSDRRLHIHEA